MKIDADSGGTVDWDEFMNYMLLENETLAVMKAEHFEYKKNNRDDPPPTWTNLCHKDMITCMITIYPDLSGNQKFGSKDPNKRKQYT